MILKYFYSRRKNIIEHTDWIADLALGLNADLSLKLHVKDVLFCHLFEAICAFEINPNRFET